MFGWLVEVSSVRTFARVRENSGKTGKKKQGSTQNQNSAQGGSILAGKPAQPTEEGRSSAEDRCAAALALGF